MDLQNNILGLKTSATLAINELSQQLTNADSNPIISTVIENLYENIEKENITIEPLSYEVKY